MNVFDQMFGMQLQNSASDLSPTSNGLVYFNSATHFIKYYNSSAWKIVVDTDGTQTLTNKTMDGGSNTFTNLPLTTSVTGVLPIANGGTNAATSSAARTNLGVAIGSNVEAWSTTLDSFAAYNTNGLLVQTAANTFTGRTITGTTNRLTVSNGDGVAGNPTLDISASYVGQSSITTLGTIGTGVWSGTAVAIVSGGTGATTASGARTNLGVAIGTNVEAWDATLDALAAYNTNGLLTQTAADTFTGRTITGTANRIAVSNGSGVSGNPTLDIDAAYVGQSSITTLGTITTGVWNGTTIAIANGGSGATSANSALNAFLPSQGSNAGKVLSTDGTNTSWASVATTSLAQFNVNIGDSGGAQQPTNTNLLGDVKGSFVSQAYTVTNASPAVFTITGHGYSTGDKVYVTVTQNGFTANTTYFVVKIDANSFNLASTVQNAFAGTKMNSSGSTAGVIVSGGLKFSSPLQIWPWLAYTPTITGFGTVSALTAAYRRVGDTLEVMFNFTSGVSTGASATVSMPTGITVSTIGIDTTRRASIGAYNETNQLSSAGTMTVVSGATTVGFSTDGNSDGVDVGTSIAVNTQKVGGFFKMPITEWAF